MQFGNRTIVLGARWRMLLVLPVSIILPVLILMQFFFEGLTASTIPELSVKLAGAIAFAVVLWYRVPTTVMVVGSSSLRFGPYFTRKLKFENIGRIGAKDVRSPPFGKLLGWHIIAERNDHISSHDRKTDSVLVLVLDCPDPAEHVASILQELATLLKCDSEPPVRSGAPDVLKEILRIGAVAGSELIDAHDEESEATILKYDLTGALFGNPLRFLLLAAGLGLTAWSAISFSIPKALAATFVLVVWIVMARPPVELTHQVVKAGTLRRTPRWTRHAVLKATEGRVTWMGVPVAGVEVFLRNGEREDLPGSALLSSSRASEWIAAINRWSGYPLESAGAHESALTRFLATSNDEPTGQ